MSHTVRRGAAAAVAAALAFGTVASSAAAPDSPRPGTETPTAPTAGTTGESTQVTLLTGDVVRVTSTDDGRPAVSVEPVSGGIQTYTVGTDVYVVPDVATPYIAAGTLDDQLFNISKLIDYGYDDASAESIPLIATYATPAARSRGSALPGTDVVRSLTSIDGAALAVDKSATDDLWSSLTGDSPATRTAQSAGDLGAGVDTLWLDGRVEPTLDVSAEQVHAPEAWAAGFDGTGATVAVLDTGIDADHPDISAALDEAVSFVPGEEVTDVDGHGTHVASTVIGDGTASDGLYRGIAPGAALKVGKVLSDEGYGLDSWVIAGMEWAAANADVVNMSLGDSERTDGLDPLSQALNRLTTETGTLFVVAAGNSGGEGTIGAPGAADLALTIGAVDDNDQRTYFTSMGPRTGDGAVKPDMSAPGQGIVAARSQYSPGTGAYQSLSGTSMATPHVSGAAAIVRAAHPDWTAAQVKNALMSTSDPLDATPYELGAGRLNVIATVTADITATGSTFLGRFAYPHDGDDPVTQTITYTNHGDTDVALTLDADVSGPSGPVDLVTLSTTDLVVPAGESAEVTVTADLDDVAELGRFTGAVTASAGDAIVTRTAVALEKEPERYNVDITVLGRDGEPTAGAVYFYRYGDQYVHTLPIDPSTGSVQTQRIDPGIVNATAFLEVEGDNGPDSRALLLLGDPHVDVTGGDVAVTFDARDAVEVAVETPRPSEDRYKRIQYFHDSGIGGQFAAFSASYEPGPHVAQMFAVPTGSVDGAMYDFAATWRRSAPLLDVMAFAPWRTDVDPLYQAGSARFDGRLDLHGVTAGTGTPAEYEGIDAAGKAVVITRSDDVDPSTRAAAADAAGAAMLIVVNDGPGTPYERAGGTEVPVVGVTAEQGAALIQGAANGRLRIRGTGIEFSPYMYSISQSWPGEIPADLTVAPTEDDLARIDTRFVDTDERLAFETTYDCRDYQWPPCLGTAEPQGTQTERVDYVSTDEGNTWYQTARHVDDWEQRGVRRGYEPGSVQSIDWFAPVVRPRLGEGYWGARHQGDWFAMNVPPSSGSGGITGSRGQGYDERIESRLYQDGELVFTSPSQSIQRSVPVVDGPATYRYEMDTVAVEGDPWADAIRTSTAWDFVADQASPPGSDGLWTYLPLLQLDYDVDVAVDGTAAAGKRGVIGISARHEPGVTGAGAVQEVTLEISYDDGATWTPVPLSADGTGTVTYPKDAQWVSLRATAGDDAGNRVEQEVIRAYGLG